MLYKMTIEEVMVWGSYGGRISVVLYTLEQGAKIHAYSKFIRQRAKDQGYYDLMQTYLEN